MNKQWQDQVALTRFQLIAPLLDPELDSAKSIQLRKNIAEANNISIRSIYRYEKAFRNGEFEGLRPVSREKHRVQNFPDNFENLLQEAIQLRKEVPGRSVEQIIYILEKEHRVAPGVLKRSTLQRHLEAAGFGAKQLKTYKDARESSSKRFCKPHRMMLIQGDIKYGPYLPLGRNGAKVQTYLSSAIDDHSRFLLASRFYDNQEEAIVEDTFRTAITRYGKFDACYFDNGSQYIAKQIKFSLSRLGIRVMHAKPRSGKSKGKIEKFHQVVDSFLREARLKNYKTLEELNAAWDVFKEEYYHRKAHAGIAEYYESLGASVPENGISPMQEFNRDSRPLSYIDTAVVAEAFLHHETRKVDKGACISFRGQRYETKPALIGCEVEISYDPADATTLTVRYSGVPPFTVQPLKIGEFCDRNETLPVKIQETPTTSRLLDALSSEHEQHREQQANAISFASYMKGGKDNV